MHQLDARSARLDGRCAHLDLEVLVGGVFVGIGTAVAGCGLLDATGSLESADLGWRLRFVC